MRLILVAFYLLFCLQITAAEHRQAKATPIVVNGFVVDATITDPGSGYREVPTVTIEGGGGNGATARAEVSPQGTVTRLVIENAGRNYSTLPTITILPPHVVGLHSVQVLPVLIITNSINRNVQIRFSENVESSNWTALTNFVATSNPQVFVDLEASGKPKRFYEVVTTQSGTTAGTTGSTTAGSTTGNTTGSSTGDTTGSTTGTTSGTNGGTAGTTSGTTGTIPRGNAPTTIVANTTFDVQISGGAFAGSNYSVTLSGSDTGTFNISNGAAGRGTYTYIRTASNAGTVIMHYNQPVQGERDTMRMNFTTATSGSFTGSQRVDGGNGVFAERTDFAGTFNNLRTQ